MDWSDLKIIYEDNHLIAANKPAGVLAQGDVTGDIPIIDFVKGYIKHRYNKPGDVFLGLIHRLDRPVSGVIVFARTSKALTRMNKMFQDRKIDKVYWAISGERPYPLEGTLKNYLLKDKEKNVTKVYEKLGRRTKDAKLSELSYKLLREINGHNLIEVKPKSGRPHQIRAQLAHHGSVIRGDIKYGYSRKNKTGKIFLHAKSLSFIHPVKLEPIVIDAEIPDRQVWHDFVNVEGA